MAKIKQSFVHYPGNDNIYEVVDKEARETKQNKLVSGSNIKTINNKTILGSGNIQTLTPEQLGQPNGVAQLDKDGFIPGNLIPNAYDDIVDGTFVNDTTFNGANGNPVIPAKNKIYYDTTTLKRYGWSGTKFVEFSGSGLILGDIEGTAYDGAKGKQNETDIANLKNDKLDKVAEQEKVYATDGLGSQTTIQYNVEPYGDGLAQRTGDGRVKGNEGTEANDLVNKTQLDKKTNYQGTHLKEGLESIIDKKSFYKYFFDKRNEPTQNYVIEGGSEQTPTNENIITALGGFPDGFKRKSHWFILINLLGNSNNHLTNGITLELLIRGSVENDFYQMFIHSYNGTNGTYDSGWQNIKGQAITQATEQDLGGVRVKTATDDQTDFVGIDSQGLLKVKPSGGSSLKTINDFFPLKGQEFIGGAGTFTQLTDEWLENNIRDGGCTGKYTDMKFMFNQQSNITTIPRIDTHNVTNMSKMIYKCLNLTSIPLLDTSKVTDMSNMFNGCSSLISIPLLDTSKVTTMYGMFNGCSKLTTIPLLDTSKVTDMSSMFYGCKALVTIPPINTMNVTNINSMFNECSQLITIPLLNTKKCNYLGWMFYGCTSLVSVPALDCGLSFSLSSMFSNCINLEEINLINIKADLNIHWSTKMTREAINVVIENLINVGEKRTLTMAQTMKDKLTPDDMQVAYDKGWDIAIA